MKSYHIKCRTVSMALITAMIFIASCEKKDVFNPNKVKATYEDRFPVKDIDPNMDWKMTHKVNVRVGVYEDAGVDYTVRLYDNFCLHKARPTIPCLLPLPSTAPLHKHTCMFVALIHKTAVLSS